MAFRHPLTQLVVREVVGQAERLQDQVFEGAGVLGDCPGCVAQSCPSELSGCSQTSGCIELVQCAQASGCSLSDYGCLLFGCGAYMINFKAVPAAMSLGGCAAQACAVECS